MKSKNNDGKPVKKPAGKKLFSIFEIYGLAVKAFFSARFVSKGRKAGTFDEQFQERIMLAVTAVNDCPMCSYAHTGMALKAGMSNEEIKSFLAGEFPDIPANQVKAVVFAQHYADQRGKPTRAAWNEIVQEYGKDLAKSILGATRIMMLGNSMGMAIGSIRSRFKGKGGDPRSNVFYEIIFVLFLLPVLILSGLQALIMMLFIRDEKVGVDK